MKSITIPGYQDIYGNSKPELKNLLKGISSKAMIKLLAWLNSKLYLEENNTQIHVYLLESMLKNLPEDDCKLILKGVSDSSLIWSSRMILELMNKIFENYDDVDESWLLTPEQRLCLIKAYFLLVDEITETEIIFYKKIQDEILNDHVWSYQRKAWPFIFKQHEFNDYKLPRQLFIYAFAFIKYVINNSELKDYLTQFLTINGLENVGNYFGTSKNLVEYCYVKESEINIPEGSNLRLDFLSINTGEFKNTPKNMTNYYGLKVTPLLKLADFLYVILFPPFLNNKIYTGLLFDFFYKTSLCESDIYNKKFSDYKSAISKKVIEEIVFMEIMKKIFPNKYLNKVKSKDGESIPDYYHRIDNYIFLFEFKDYLISDKIVESYSFEEIKMNIDNKYVKEGGIPQLINQIAAIKKGGLACDDLTKLLQGEGVILFPIIVYTNFLYSMPGVNDYLQEEFENELVNSAVENESIHVSIQKLVLINLEFFYDAFETIIGDHIVFVSFLNNYNTRKEKLLRIYKESNKEYEDYLKCFVGFEEMYISELSKGNNAKGKDYVTLITNALGIDQSMMSFH